MKNTQRMTNAHTRRPAGRPLLTLLLLLSLFAPVPAQRASRADLQAIRRYIKQGWHTLERGPRQLAAAAVDPKFATTHDERWPVYVPADENLPRIGRSLRAEMPAYDFTQIELRQLPAHTDEIQAQGLLYLPHPYVVPGGRFNEMYGWDSYFIQVGLVRDGEWALARDMCENFLYEIEHYGKILNANRTYYLTRSQPPFLTQMILNVYRHDRDRAWLARTLPALEKYYAYWTTAPHLTPETGLARYYDAGHGPAPEVVAGERDAQGRTHYDRVREFYRTRPVYDYDVSQYYDRARDELTEQFYTGDRSMRESGFDPSNRFGPFNADITNYNPVCLNSLLYLMERDAAQIARILGRPQTARVWTKRAEARRRLVNKLMWDESDGLYFDYNFRQRAVRRYHFVTTFYPLWVGLATRRQAARVAANLWRLERLGGLETSDNQSGNQWDAPYGWAPMQLLAVKGLRRYGYNKAADRISVNFLSLVLREFIAHRTIVEKYDVALRASDLGAGLKFGYTSNEIGFGWTNAAFVELYAGLTPAHRSDVLRLDGIGVPPQSKY
jgi:alpha,alpha-trehalase